MYKKIFTCSIILLLNININSFANSVGYTEIGKLVGDYSFDRSDFGKSKIKSWYPYLPFEEEALSAENIKNAKNGDPKALLKLAFLASGDIEKQDTFEKYFEEYNTFINKIRSEINAQKDIYNKGKHLFEHLCQQFYKQGFFNDQNKGYQYEKSNITAIFENSRYNCISSTLLYMIIAREFNLDVFCVSVPSHVFVQINAENNMKIEVETTTKKGYDFKHTEEYFKNANSIWLKQRGLGTITYNDYLKRKMLTPFDAVFENMYNQHTSDEKMSAFNRNKIYEAMGFLKESEFAQIARLGTYNNEYFYMARSNNVEDMNRMFKIVLPFVAEVYKKSITIDLKNTSAILLSYYGNLCSRNGRLKEASDITTTLLKDFDKSLPNAEQLTHNIYAMISTITNSYVEKQMFSECDSFLNANKAFFDFKRDEINYCFRYLNSKKAVYYWDLENWNGVIESLTKESKYIHIKKDLERNRKNLMYAYLQLSDVFAIENKYKEALGVLDKCIKEIPKCEPCIKRKKHFNGLQ